MATPEPNPYRQLNYPINNLEQNFDQTQKIQVRANIGIPTSVSQTNKVLGVTAATGELGWVPQSGGSAPDELIVNDFVDTATFTAKEFSSSSKTALETFLKNHSSSDIEITFFARPDITSQRITTVPFVLELAYTDLEDAQHSGTGAQGGIFAQVSIPCGFRTGNVWDGQPEEFDGVRMEFDGSAAYYKWSLPFDGGLKTLDSATVINFGSHEYNENMATVSAIRFRVIP